MEFAKDVAKLSHAERKKVGAVIVNDNTVVYGYNGTPAEWDNCCEDKVYWNSEFEDLHYDELDLQYPYVDAIGRYCLKTKPEVLHAEMNALSKIAQTTVSSTGATLFVTLAPCIDCAKAIYQAGIKRVFYLEDYRTNDGLVFLKRARIEVTQIKKGQ